MSAEPRRQKTIIAQTRFLVIDTEPNVGEGLRRFLISEGSPAVYFAASSLLALRVLQDRKTPIDCVIVAHRPTNSGVEFLTNLRSGRWGGPVQYLPCLMLLDKEDGNVIAAANAVKVTGFITGGLGKENVRHAILKALDPKGIASALPNFKVAHIRASEADLVLAPFPASFARLSTTQQQQAIQAVTTAARNYGMNGAVIVVYPGEGGKAEFIAPDAFKRFLSKLTVDAANKMLNRAIRVEWIGGDPTQEPKVEEAKESVDPLPLFDDELPLDEEPEEKAEESSDRRRGAGTRDSSASRPLSDDDIRGVAKAFKEMGPIGFVERFVRQQTILIGDQAQQTLTPSMREFFVSIELLRKEFFPGVDMRGSKRAFQNLTHMLDQLMLRSLAHLPRDGVPCSLNLNVHSILTQTFDAALKDGSAENLIFEIPQPMITQYFEEFKKARDLIWARGGRIAVDQIFPDSMGALDLSLVGPQIAKVHWKGDLKNFSAQHRDFVRSTLERGITMVMSRVDDPAALEIAQDFGIRNFQGFLIDEMPEAKI